MPEKYRVMIISTHALHEEGDDFCAPEFDKQHRISTHALHEEGDICSSRYFIFLSRFLPTPSTRRATYCGCNP